MKRKNQNSLFLIEIILSIFIFACTTAICIQIFVNADQLNKKTNYQNFALNQCQNISETWIGTSSSLEDTLDFLYRTFSSDSFLLFGLYGVRPQCGQLSVNLRQVPAQGND